MDQKKMFFHVCRIIDIDPQWNIDLLRKELPLTKELLNDNIKSEVH